jgi:hypothetical protein
LAAVLQLPVWLIVLAGKADKSPFPMLYCRKNSVNEELLEFCCHLRKKMGLPEGKRADAGLTSP